LGEAFVAGVWEWRHEEIFTRTRGRQFQVKRDFASAAWRI
jgi:hypothetical protein